MKQLFASLLFIAGTTFAMEESKPTSQMVQFLTKESIETIDWMFQENILNLTKQDSKGNTLLHKIVKKGNSAVLEKLGNRVTSEAKAIQNNKKKTPDNIINDIILKSISSITSHNPEEFKKFQRCKEILQFNVGAFSDEIYTPKNTTINSLEKLLKDGIINFNLYDDEGNTYFHVICANAPAKTLKMLIKYVPRNVYYKKNIHGLTPPLILKERMVRLDTIDSENQKESIEIKKVLSSYEKLQRKNDKKPVIDSTLYDSNLLYNSNLLGCCVKFNTISFSAKDSSGNTILHKLAEKGCYDLITLQGFTTVNQKNSDGCTPKQVAQQKLRQLIEEDASKQTVENYLKTIEKLEKIKQATDCTII